jgi:hypothetical protein
VKQLLVGDHVVGIHSNIPGTIIGTHENFVWVKHVDGRLFTFFTHELRKVPPKPYKSWLVVDHTGKMATLHSVREQFGLRPGWDQIEINRDENGNWSLTQVTHG